MDLKENTCTSTCKYLNINDVMYLESNLKLKGSSNLLSCTYLDCFIMFLCNRYKGLYKHFKIHARTK